MLACSERGCPAVTARTLGVSRACCQGSLTGLEWCCCLAGRAVKDREAGRTGRSTGRASRPLGARSPERLSGVSGGGELRTPLGYKRGSRCSQMQCDAAWWDDAPSYPAAASAMCDMRASRPIEGGSSPPQRRRAAGAGLDGRWGRAILLRQVGCGSPDRPGVRHAGHPVGIHRSETARDLVPRNGPARSTCTGCGFPGPRRRRPHRPLRALGPGLRQWEVRAVR